MGPLSTLLSLINEVKVWIMGFVGAVTLLVLIWDGIKYQQGSAGEKQDAIKNIKNHIYMGVGIFILVWFAGYAIQKFGGTV